MNNIKIILTTIVEGGSLSCERSVILKVGKTNSVQHTERYVRPAKQVTKLTKDAYDAAIMEVPKGVPVKQWKKTSKTDRLNYKMEELAKALAQGHYLGHSFEVLED